jgi:ATP-dependent RNA helicase DDX10/DBP4
MFRKKNLTVLSDHYAKLKDKEESDVSDKSDSEFMTIKRRDHDIDDINKVLQFSY